MSQTENAPPPLDLRAARVAAVREHPNADRLLLLDIDLGGEIRQIVAALAGHYEPAELEGRSIVVVANLQPARLRGEVSQGMLLAAGSEDGRLGVLLAPDASPGAPLRTASGAEPETTVTIDDFRRHSLEATPDGVVVNGEPLEGARLEMDREIYGPLR